jgi:hypothetical protein
MPSELDRLERWIGFASHLGESTSLMNLASSNLLTSTRMVSCLSSVYILSFCLIGLNVGSMSNSCSITSLGIPGISDICYVKTSRFSLRKVMIASSYLTSSSVLRRSFFLMSSGSTTTSLSMPPSSCRPPSDRRWADLTWSP